MAERRLGGPKLGGKPPPDFSGSKLGGKIMPYVPRGAQYDYQPPSVFSRYKVLSAIFVILLVSLFGYWAIVVRQQPHATISSPPRRTQPASSQPAQPSPPQTDPVYIEPLPPK